MFALCFAVPGLAAEPGAAPQCRIGATAYTMTSGSGGLKATSSADCQFDAPEATATCTIQYRDSTGTVSTSTTTTQYASLDDFIDEVRVVPPLTKFLTSTGTQRSRGVTSRGTVTNSYDAQGRVTVTVTAPGKQGVSTTTYSSWDAAGRPRVAHDKGPGFNNRRDISYDDRARTRTTRVNGGLVVTVETFDANGNPLRQTTSNGTGTPQIISTFQITATEKICR
jgi:hypothetical protein